MRPIERLEVIVRQECPVLLENEVLRLVKEINATFNLKYNSAIQEREEKQ